MSSRQSNRNVSRTLKSDFRLISEHVASPRKIWTTDIRAFQAAVCVNKILSLVLIPLSLLQCY